MRIILISVGLAGLGMTVAACGGEDESGAPGVEVVATTPLVADLARNVAGARAEVTSLLSANADPHDYEPRPSDAAALEDADLVLRSGGELDEWTGELTGDEPLSLIDEVQTLEGDDGEPDPHWWHDPDNAIAAVQAIRVALTQIDPEGAERYAANARRYESEIRAADKAVGRCMRRVPAAQRKLVTTHDSLGYFARRYGIVVIGSVIPSLSTAAQPSAGDTAELIEQIERERVRVVFAESSVDSKLESAIARDAGAEVGDEIWADGLGPEGSTGATYVEALAANADALARGFSGGAVTCEPNG